MEPAANGDNAGDAGALAERAGSTVQMGRRVDNLRRPTGESNTMTTHNQCQFWNCNENLRRRDHFLCSTHYSGYEAGTIDQCPSPSCGRYKETEDPVCLNCYRQTASAWSRQSAAGGSRNGGEYRANNVNRNECRFWSCAETIRAGHYLCLDHFIQERQGRINRCRSCTNYKAMRFPQCYSCHQPSEIQEGNAPAAEVEDNHSTTEFFVYVLTLDGGAYYVGNTNDLHARLQEHRTNMSQSTRGRGPKLVWFTTVPTRSEAEDLEKELNNLNVNTQTRREIHRMVVRFKQLVGELDFAAPKSEVESTIQERRMPYGGVAPPSPRRQR